MLDSLRPHLAAVGNDGAPNLDSFGVYFYDTSRISDDPAPYVPAPAVLPETVADEEQRRADWLAEREELLGRTSLGLPVTAVSSIESAERPGATDDAEFTSRLPGEQDAAIDNALHRIMERVYLPNARNLDELARWFSANAGLLEESEEIFEMARNALDSPIVARAIAVGRFQRDVVFSVLLPDSGFAEGRVDLLFRDAAGLVVVDYKTDQLTATEVDLRHEASRDQAALYAYAVEAASGISVSEVVFVFARPAVEQSIPIDAALRALGEALMLRHRTYGLSERPTTGKRRNPSLPRL
jgi:ATP-dependent exoDNAse (exonuclease V) beta subunit